MIFKEVAAESFYVGGASHTKNDCANEGTTDLTLGLFEMLFQDVLFGCRNAGERLAAHKR